MFLRNTQNMSSNTSDSQVGLEISSVDELVSGSIPGDETRENGGAGECLEKGPGNNVEEAPEIPAGTRNGEVERVLEEEEEEEEEEEVEDQLEEVKGESLPSDFSRIEEEGGAGEGRVRSPERRGGERKGRRDWDGAGNRDPPSSGRKRSGGKERVSESQKDREPCSCIPTQFLFLPTFALPLSTFSSSHTNHLSLSSVTSTNKDHRATSTATSTTNRNPNRPSTFNHRFLFTLAPSISRCCCCRRRRKTRRSDNERGRGMKTYLEKPSGGHGRYKRKSDNNLLSYANLEHKKSKHEENKSRFLHDNNNIPGKESKVKNNNEWENEKLVMDGKIGSKKRKKSKRRKHRSPSSSSCSSALSGMEGSNSSRKTRKKRRKAGKSKKSKRSRRHSSRESRSRKSDKSSKKKKKRRYRSGSQKRTKVKSSAPTEKVIPCCCHSSSVSPSGDEEDGDMSGQDGSTGKRNPSPVNDVHILTPTVLGDLTLRNQSKLLPSLNLGGLAPTVSKVPLGLFCVQVTECQEGKNLTTTVTTNNHENDVGNSSSPKSDERLVEGELDERKVRSGKDEKGNPISSIRTTNGFGENEKKGEGPREENEANNGSASCESGWDSSRRRRSHSRSITRSRSASRSLSRSRSPCSKYTSSPGAVSHRRSSRSGSSVDSRTSAKSLRSSSWRSGSSRSKSSSISRSMTSRSRSGSRDLWRSRSKSGSSSNSRSRSNSRSQSRGSGSRSPSRSKSRTRSRSVSIPRRRGSPSFLDRRRITSARKRPIPYKRKSGSEWEVSSDSSDSSF